MFETAITRLASWWSNSFFRIDDIGHIRSRTFDDVAKEIAASGCTGTDDLFQLLEEDYEGEGELIRSEKSLMKHALMRSGSRDTSAQLFTSLCRALGIPTRLVVSLQSVPWRAGVGKPSAPSKKSKKGKEKADVEPVSVSSEEQEDGDDMETAGIPLVDRKGKGKAVEFTGEGQRLDGLPASSSAKGKGKAKAKPVIKLRKSRGQKLGGPSIGRNAKLSKCILVF